MGEFRFKHFVLQNTRSAMKITTDSVLLGSWVRPEGCMNILDIGTGTGVIALMVAQRSAAGSHIIGIDIDEISAEEAAGNFAASPWNSRLCSEWVSLQDFMNREQPEIFDLIVSNPPFFNNSLKSDNSRKMGARHTDGLPACDLIAAVCKLLKSEGRFSLILPCPEAAEFMVDAIGAGLFLLRETYVRADISKPAKRVLLEFGRTANEKVSTQVLTLAGDAHKKQVAEYYE